MRRPHAKSRGAHPDGLMVVVRPLIVELTRLAGQVWLERIAPVVLILGALELPGVWGDKDSRLWSSRLYRQAQRLERRLRRLDGCNRGEAEEFG